MLELLPLVAIALLFWLFLIRPASRRQRELRQMQSALSVGDQVVLTSGVYGTVRLIEDAYVLVEIAEGVTIKVARAAIGTIDTKAEAPDEETAQDDYDEHDPTQDDDQHDDQHGTTADGREEN